MPKSVNKVILVGNVGKDPEVKYAPSGVAIAKFSLATNERFKDKSGEWQDRTEWHNVTSSWEDRQSGDKKFRTEIVARDIVLLGTPDATEHGTRHADEEREPVVAGAGEITDDDIPF
jgi:single-strand DNA-binding protein